MSGDSLRIGVVGVGFGASVHIPAFQSEGIDVVAVCSRRQERAEEAAEKFGIANVFTDYDEMLRLDGLDAISIATPPALHLPMSLAALTAGKHLICEKPFALNTAEAQTIYDAAQASNLTAVIAHEFRYSSGRAYARELIADGYIGNLRLCLMRLVFGTPPLEKPPKLSLDRDLAERGGGFLFSLGSHYIDCLRYWFGEVESVTGDLRTLMPERRGESKKIIMSDADDTFSMTLNFVNGGFAQMTSSRAASFGAGSAVEIYGDEGTIFLPQDFLNPPSHGTVLAAKAGDEKLEQIPVPDRLQSFQDDRDDRLFPFRMQVRDFLRGIDEGSSPAPNFYDGLRCQQVLDAVRESSATGRQVAVPAG